MRLMISADKSRKVEVFNEGYRMQLIVCGGRDFNDYDFLKMTLDDYLDAYPDQDVLIISGGAKGADTLGARYADENGFDKVYFHVDWEKYGKSAGYVRSNQMVEEATHVVAFWNGKSKGTQHLITQAIKKKLKVRVVEYD